MKEDRKKKREREKKRKKERKKERNTSNKITYIRIRIPSYPSKMFLLQRRHLKFADYI